VKLTAFVEGICNWIRFALVLPFKAKFVWKCQCKVCGVKRAPWRMLVHWQPMNLPGVVGHRGGCLCRPCHQRLCGRQHRSESMCAKDLGSAILPTWNWPHADIDAMLEEEADQ
jgi:hypothetical protein